MKRKIGYSLLFATIFIADRVTKFFAFHYLNHCYEISSFLSFNLAFNRGIVCGIFNTGPTITFVTVSSLIILVYGFFAHFTFERLHNNYLIVPEILILAGGISNILDRFLYHGVVDFIVFHVKTWSWPAFNIADMCIVIGILLLGAKCIKE